jgi:hypothetical protein
MPPPTAPPPPQGTMPPPEAPPPAAPPALPPAAASPTRASPTKPQTATAAGVEASASTEASGDLGPIDGEIESDESDEQFFVLELGAGPDVNGRFPNSDRTGDSEDRVDGVVGLGAWLDFGRSLQLGLYGQYAGLGKEQFAITPSGESLDANYAAMTLWLAGRFFFDARRPAFYLTAALGPTLQRVRATGTRSGAPFVAPGTSFQCSDIGGLGAGALLAAGLEAELAGGLSLLGELQGAGHLLSGADDALDGCAPGTGPAIYGVARVAFAYRFEL